MEWGGSRGGREWMGRPIHHRVCIQTALEENLENNRPFLPPTNSFTNPTDSSWSQITFTAVSHECIPPYILFFSSISNDLKSHLSCQPQSNQRPPGLNSPVTLLSLGSGLPVPAPPPPGCRWLLLPAGPPGGRAGASLSTSIPPAPHRHWRGTGAR